MAQYYTKRPHRGTPLSAQPSSGQRKASGVRRELATALAVPNSSFYIFPNPSELSATLSPSSGVSELASPVDAPFSPCSEVPSITGSTFSTPCALTPAEERGTDWEWPKGFERTAHSPPTRPHISRNYLWAPGIAKKPLDPGPGLPDISLVREAPARADRPPTFACEKDAATPSGSMHGARNESVAPSSQPIAHIPFLSFFASLISVDRATHDMISTSFVPSLCSHTVCLKNRGSEEELEVPRRDPEFKVASEAHGMEVFLASTSEEAPLFRGPMQMGDHIPPIPGAFHLCDVLDIVTGIGGQLLYVVFRL